MVNFVVKSSLAAVMCLAAAICDRKTGKIPNRLVFGGIIIGLLLTIIMKLNNIWITLLLLVFLFFFGMTGAAGLGDIKLLMAIGAIGGWKMDTVALISAVFLVLLCAIISRPAETYIYFRKMIRRLKGKRLPINYNSSKYYFAPFLFVGVLIYIGFFDEYSPFKDILAKIM